MTEKQRKRRRIAVIKILYEMSKGVCIIDEYGQKWSLEDFKAMVDRKRTERFGSTDDRKVLDADGYVINFYEFS